MIPDKKPIRFITLLIHLLMWTMLFVSPFFFMPNEIDEKWVSFYWRYCQTQAIIVFIFYINYFFLINKLLFQKKILKFLMWNSFLILTCGVVLYFYEFILFPIPKIKHPGPPELPNGWLFHISRNVVLYFLTAALSVAIKMTTRWYREERERKELEKIHAEAELKNLKSQLNPHFLFNTLNNIYALVAITPEGAQEALHRLSKLLRYVLYDNNEEEVPITREIEFIRNYLDLVRLRFSSKVNIEFAVNGPVRDTRIAPLLFISLVENAFKHGVSPKENSFVKISLDLTHADRIHFVVANSFFPKGKEDKSGSGIGLDNLRKRLTLLYGDRFRFIAKREGEQFLSSIQIHL